MMELNLDGNCDGTVRSLTGARRRRSGGLPHAPRVLHVDRDGDSALTLAALLVPEARLTHVATLEAAMQAIARTRYTLVVLDPNLPDGDGVILLDALESARAPTPLLLYAEQDPHWRGQGGRFLHKPLTSPRQLWRMLSELLDGITPPAAPPEPQP